MNRIDTIIRHAQENKRTLVSPYIVAGDPDLQTTLNLMHTLVKNGADILEIGIPFSDPMAEGPVIQEAMERALLNNTTTEQILNLIKDFRMSNQITAIVVMGYVNPIECYGYARFAQDAEAAGVDGTILVDMPPEESVAISDLWQQHNLYPIYLCSPTTSPERMQLINELARGYLYFVSLKGVTGSSAFNIENVQTIYDERKKQAKLPVLVGFGIKTAAMAAQVAEFADGVIIGAALIEVIFNAKDDCYNAAGNLLHSIRTAVDNGK